MPASEFVRGNNSFSGVDIKAVFAGRAVGNLQGISYSITREKAGVWTMGSADPRGFSRGKRAIAGSLVFVQFDTEPLLYELANPNNLGDALYFQADRDDIRPEYDLSGNTVSVTESSVFSESGIGPGTAAQDQESDLGTVYDDQAAALPWYPDQIPPIDIVLTAANEYGALAIMKILGVEILNGGYGVSIDDLVCEHSYTFIATGIHPWTWQKSQAPFQSPIRRGGAFNS